MNLNTNIPNINIMQWNVRGVFNNLENIRHIIYKEDSDIILLNETWLKKHNNFNHNGFHVYREDRNDGYGGIATLIKKNQP